MWGGGGVYGRNWVGVKEVKQEVREPGGKG